MMSYLISNRKRVGKTAILHAAILSVLILCFFTGCVFVNFGNPGGVSGSGIRESYSLNTGIFTGIIMEASMDVHYHAYGDGIPEGTVILEVQGDLREYFALENNNNVLRVYTTERINFASSLTPVLRIYVPVLNSVKLSGAGNFYTHDTIKTPSFSMDLSGAYNGTLDFDVDNLFIGMSGAGRFAISGTAAYADMRITGAGDLNALELTTNGANVNISGAGTVSLTVIDELSISASGMGNVVYRGSPSLDLNTSGMVNIRRRD